MSILHTIGSTDPVGVVMTLLTGLVYVIAAIGLFMIIVANGLRHTARYHGKKKARRRRM